MLRWIAWFWRHRTPRRYGVCRACDCALEPCAECEGDWRATPCRACQLGLVCPTHANHWI